MQSHKRLFFSIPSNSFSFFLMIILIFITLILLNPINLSYAQNLSSTVSLKANAGEDQYIEEGQPVILNAEDSVSSNPPIDAYKWIQLEPKSPSIDLENSDTARASFTSPNLPNNQYFVFQLIVKDENITDTDTVNIYVVEDLESIDKSKGGVGGGGYQPEICYDGADNDLDGKIDNQDEDCGTIFRQIPNQIPFSPRDGGIPFNPNLPEGLQEQIPGRGQVQPNFPGRAQPGQIQPGQGQIIR